MVANQVMVAACLVQPGSNRMLPLRCYNVAEDPGELRPGMKIAGYLEVSESQVTR